MVEVTAQDEFGEGVVTAVPPAHRRHGVAGFRLAAQLDVAGTPVVVDLDALVR